MRTKRFLVLAAAALLAGVLVGCTEAQHQAVADGAGKVQQVAEEGKEVVGGPIGKTVSGVVSTLPIPGAQAVEPARVSIEWILGSVAAVAGAVAAWQQRKAATTKKERIEMQRVIDDQEKIDEAFAKAHGQCK